MSDLRELEAAASAAPWRAEHAEHGPATVYDSQPIGWLARIKESLPTKNADAALIAASRNALPFLLDVADAARDLLDAIVVGDRQGNPKCLICHSELDGEYAHRDKKPCTALGDLLFALDTHLESER